MSHSTKVTIIADQYINICGKEINIHDLRSITLNGYGQAVGYVENDQKTLSIRIDLEKFKVTKRYTKFDTEGNVWQSDGFDGFEVWEKCEIITDNSEEEFNCSEDYFKRNLEPKRDGDPASSWGYQEFICKVCGWSFMQDAEAGMTQLILDKMRDHVYLKHK